MKKVVLRNFSDIATHTGVAQKLRNMRMTSDQPIASYNYNYAAVHEAAFDIHPSEQRMRFALEDYANSLPEYTADKLSYKIVKVNSWIKTLQGAMDHAVKIDQESRQSKVMRNRRNNSSELIDTTVNEISDRHQLCCIQTRRQQIQQHNETWISKRKKRFLPQEPTK